MAPLSRPEEGERAQDPFGDQSVATVLWPALANPKSYRIGGSLDGEEVDLVCFDIAGGCWWLGRFGHARFAHAFAHKLLLRAGTANDSVFIIEWVLLRHALETTEAGSFDPERFRFQISIVLMREEVEDAQLQTMASLLRPHIPAHLEMRLHVYGPRRFGRFLDHRAAWLKSLAGNDAHLRASTSRRLARFLLDPTAPAFPPEVPGPPQPATPVPAAPSAASAAPTAPSAPAPQVDQPTVPSPPIPILPPVISASLLAPEPVIGEGLALQMVATAALAGAEGVLGPQPLALATLRHWRLAELRFLLRPLPWRADLPGTLEGGEVATLMREGMALMPGQDTSAAALDAAAADLGQRHGLAATTAAKTLR
ncbi:MAG: hypothetical protein ACK5QW_05290, partial [Cyanobacteriota bacterium]